MYFVRLQPLVVLGDILVAALFDYLMAFERFNLGWDGIAATLSAECKKSINPFSGCSVAERSSILRPSK